MIQGGIEFKWFFQLFHDESCYHIKTSPLICAANQWTGFYMITVFVMKELNSVNIRNITRRRFLLTHCHWSLSIPPENRKPKFFWCFQGASKETCDMKCVKEITQQFPFFFQITRKNICGYIAGLLVRLYSRFVCLWGLTALLFWQFYSRY